MTADLWRAVGRPVRPWRNGGGVTRDVACYPETGQFDWRVSVADVDRDGAFSSFEGVDRVIVMIAGAAMTLTVGGVPHELQRYVPFAFDGGQPTSCRLAAGPTRDLNVMTRRRQARSAVEVVEVGVGGPVRIEPGDPLLLVALTGRTTVTSTGQEAVLDPLDALEWPGPRPVLVSGAGSVAAIRFSRA